MPRGLLYVLVQPGTHRPIKVGRTTRTIEERVREISQATGVPYDLVCPIHWVVDEVETVEGLAHAALRKHRIRARKEWFEISVDEASEILAKVCEPHMAGRARLQIAWEEVFSSIDLDALGRALRLGAHPPVRVGGIPPIERLIACSTQADARRAACAGIGMLVASDNGGIGRSPAIASCVARWGAIDALNALERAGVPLVETYGVPQLARLTSTFVAEKIGSLPDDHYNRCASFLAALSARRTVGDDTFRDAIAEFATIAYANSGVGASGWIDRRVCDLLPTLRALGADPVAPDPTTGDTAYDVARRAGWTCSMSLLPVGSVQSPATSAVLRRGSGHHRDVRDPPRRPTCGSTSGGVCEHLGAVAAAAGSRCARAVGSSLVVLPLLRRIGTRGEDGRHGMPPHRSAVRAPGGASHQRSRTLRRAI